MLKKLGSIFCNPKEVLAWEIQEHYRTNAHGYNYGGAKYKLVLYVKNSLTFEIKIKPDEKVEEEIVDIPNGFWRRIFCRPVKTETIRNFIVIKSAQEKAEELMKGFLND